MTKSQKAEPLPPAPISSFFSAMQLRRSTNAPGPRHEPSVDHHTGAFLFLDIVSFTSLGEELSEEGLKGAETLSAILHAYFEPILDTVNQHGGDVLFFAGDAVGVVWLSEGDDIATAAVRATQCALEVQALIRSVSSPSDKTLRFRASLGVGSVDAYEVGGVEQSWMQLVRGSSIEKACLADAHGDAGQLVMSADCAEYLQACDPVVAPVADGFVEVHNLGTGIPPKKLPELDTGSQQELSLGLGLTEAVERHLYYPDSAVASEFRNATVLFADISGADLEESVRSSVYE